jgi:hypothetical protein
MVTARGAQGMSATSSHALMPLRASALNSRMIFAEPSRYWIRNCTLEILALILVDGSAATLLLRCALPRTSTAASPDWRAPRNRGPPAVRGRYAPRYRGSWPANPFIEDGLTSRSLDSSAVGVVALCGNPRKLLTRRLRLRDLVTLALASLPAGIAAMVADLRASAPACANRRPSWRRWRQRSINHRERDQAPPRRRWAVSS